MARHKRRKARRAKRRGFGGTVEQHRAGAVQDARTAQKFFRAARTAARAGRCDSAMGWYTSGAELFGGYITEKRYVRAVGGRRRYGAERGIRMAAVKARKALIAACFCER